MKLAVVTIAKDEQAFIGRWADSAKDADYRLIGDTGSVDQTMTVARDHGVRTRRLHVDPWRFDDARNALLALVPNDVDWVITLDADEVLVDGWRDALEKAVEENGYATRLRYHYVWSWISETEPDVMFDGDRCHRRAGYRWIGPVHEVVTWCGDGPELWRPHAGFWIHHHPDDTKSRASYLPLLERAVREEPHNPRQQVYYARELFFVGQWVQARVEFTKFLAMPEAAWPAERAQAYRYLAKMDDYPERWLLKAIAEDPTRRDAMVDLVDLLVADERWDEAKGMAARALRITGRPSDYMTTAHAYDDAHLARVLSK